MERLGLWLVRVRWSRTGLLKSPDQQPTVDQAIANDTPFIASGYRNDSDNYLFLNRADAEAFKERIEESMKRKGSPKSKAKFDIVEVTPEDVAHLDLDPAHRKTRSTKA
jgi:phosphoribosyl 1,2-cyclic phosphodiesterase